MYIALDTIILEDVFGRDNQYLKGHKYNLAYNDWTMEEHNGRSIQAFHSHKLLSKDDIEKYFRYEELPVIRGGIGLFNR